MVIFLPDILLLTKSNALGYSCFLCSSNFCHKMFC